MPPLDDPDLIVGPKGRQEKPQARDCTTPEHLLQAVNQSKWPLRVHQVPPCDVQVQQSD